MEQRIIAEYSFVKDNELDHCYQLFEDGSVIYTYDKSRYLGDQNIVKKMSYSHLDSKFKEKLFENSTIEGQAIITANFLQNDSD